MKLRHICISFHTHAIKASLWDGERYVGDSVRYPKLSRFINFSVSVEHFKEGDEEKMHIWDEYGIHAAFVCLVTNHRHHIGNECFFRKWELDLSHDFEVVIIKDEEVVSDKVYKLNNYESWVTEFDKLCEDCNKDNFGFQCYVNQKKPFNYIEYREVKKLEAQIDYSLHYLLHRELSLTKQLFLKIRIMNAVAQLKAMGRTRSRHVAINPLNKLKEKSKKQK